MWKEAVETTPHTSTKLSVSVIRYCMSLAYIYDEFNTGCRREYHNSISNIVTLFITYETNTFFHYHAAYTVLHRVVWGK